VAAGDLNDDGMVDLVVACDAGHPVPPLAGELAVLLGVGGGNFAPKVVFQNGPWQRPYLADLDVDGDLDLIASGYVFLGHGDGTFDPNPVSWFGIGSGRDDLAIGLIDDDAVPDLVIPIPDIVAPNGLEVRLGLGNGGFGSPTYVNFTEPGSAAVIHDLDGDGHADIAWTTPGTVHVVRGDGHGGFGAPHHYVACGTHGGVAAGDLNGDARPDLAFACVWYSSVALLFNDHPGYPTPTLLAVAAAEALPGLARLTWYGTGAAHLDAMVERRTDTSEWQTIGVPEAIGEDRLRFEDRTVLAGVRYGYRLVVRGGEPEGAGDVVWLAIPVEAGFALTGARPETDGRGLRVYLSLATTEEATLELLDVAGRRVERHAIGAREPGSHEVGVRTDRRLPAGVYMVRLTQGSRSATIKAAIRP
jgi:hypothetical protein